MFYIHNSNTEQFVNKPIICNGLCTSCLYATDCIWHLNKTSYEFSDKIYFIKHKLSYASLYLNIINVLLYKL